MVECKFEKGTFGYIAAEIRNHAADPKVCAATSALGMALIGTLQTIEGISIARCDYGSGIIDVLVNPFEDEQKQQEIDTIFQTVWIGLKQLESTYPDNIVVNLI
jgi:uncharacterized protein YsxB (DUF464 family)